MSPNSVSEDTFLQGCECAWSHLKEDFGTTASIRATCRGGRMLFDQHLKKLVPVLWEQRNNNDNSDQHVPSKDLCQSMLNLLNRGAKPPCLHLQYYNPQMDNNTDLGLSLWPPNVREEQLIAVLDGLSSCPPSSLELTGGIRHSEATSKRVAVRCPRLTELTLDYDSNDLPSEAGEASGAYAAGVKSLLRKVGPRLRQLTVKSAQGWPSEGVSALRVCTALTGLHFHTDSETGTIAQERRLLSRMPKLPQLRSLRLDLSLDADSCTFNAMRRHATVLSSLSALTALTSLQLGLSSCYEPAGDSWQRQQQDGPRHAAWEEVREVRRTTLLSALRCMPQLQHLSCGELWVRPLESASLTALTSLALGGLLPPEQQPAASSSTAAAAWTLPPQLQKLTLAGGASPHFLATFQPPPSLTQLKVSCIRFGRAGVSPDGCLLPQAASDVGPAAELLACFEAMAVEIVADCGAQPMEPPASAASGHEGWIRGLGPLGAQLEKLTMQGVQLLVGDLVCLVSTLPKLRTLELSDAQVPLGALHALTDLTQLEMLVLDLTHYPELTTNDLEALLALLCRKCATLSMVEVRTKSFEVDADACVERLHNKLVRWGIPPPLILVTDALDGGSDSGDSDTDSDDD